jgi:hypothetical protein
MKAKHGGATKRMGLKFFVLIAFALLVLQSAAPVNASEIIVKNADTICNVTTTYPESIPDATSRIMVEYANTISQLGLQFMPEDLTSVTRKVMPRIIVEYASLTAHRELQEMPVNLLDAMKEVPKQRSIVEYAELNVYLSLMYPVELMNDLIPPIIGDVAVINVTHNSAVITWLTDEFADSVVNYGVNSTVYTATSTGNLYMKEHGIALAGLSPGTSYYFVVKCTDRSGNSAVSMEYTFTTEG